MTERISPPESSAPFEQVPERIRSLPQWVCWRYETHLSRRKPMKTPYTPKIGKRANIHESDTWGSFEQAVASYRAGGYDGIGLVLTQSDRIVGVDIDECIDCNGTLNAIAQTVIGLLNSYTEVSPSGKGIRIFVAAALGDFAGRRGMRIELYNFNRYLTVTGNHWPGTPSEVCDRYDELRILYSKYLLPIAPAPRPARHQETASLDQSDSVVLDRLFSGKLGALYRQIYNGNTADVSGRERGETDQSRADVLLFNGLAFYTYQDADQMRRILLSSPRYNQRAHKWHKRVQGETTYLEYQIADSIRYTQAKR